MERRPKVVIYSSCSVCNLLSFSAFVTTVISVESRTLVLPKLILVSFAMASALRVARGFSPHSQHDGCGEDGPEGGL